MLGTKGAGKTCFMLAMYSKMSQGINGFTLTTQDLDQDIDLADAWEGILYGEDKDRWPPSNDADVTNYSFNFNYALTTRLMEFDWIDYRGKALDDKKTQQEDVLIVTERIKVSDCIFLCISGEYLVEPVANNMPPRESGIDRIVKFIQQGFDGSKKTIPIVILITKFDLCAKRRKEEVIEDIKQLFNFLFVPDGEWPVMICPVTLGAKLSEDINKQQIVPMGVHFPLIFAIYFEYFQNNLQLQEKERQYQQEQEKYQATLAQKQTDLININKQLTELNQRNLFSKTWDNLRGKDQTQQKSQESKNTDNSKNEAENALQATKSQLDAIRNQNNDIQKKLKLLVGELNNDNINIYIAGTEVELNV